MTDVFDRAQETEALFLRQALEAQRRVSASPSGKADWRVTSATECEASDCGEPIPEARRRAIPGVLFCIECQERFERLGRKT